MLDEHRPTGPLDSEDAAATANAAPAPGPEADPPPFHILNAEGAAPIVLVCDHASRALPADYGTLGMADDILWRHIAWDIGAADVVDRLARLLDAPAVLSGYSRLLIDCNRSLDDPTSIPPESDGEAVPGNCALDDADRRRRVERCFQPYHDAVAATIERKRTGGVVPVIVSIHSFTPVMDGRERPWHVGVLWHKDNRLSLPLLRHLRANPALVVGDNKPYSAHDPRARGYSMATHGEEAGLPHALFEIRQDLIDTHHGAESWANLLAVAIGQTIEEGQPLGVEYDER